MNKKTIAYILIGVGVVALIIYLVLKGKKAPEVEANAGTAADPRGDLAPDDDTTYNNMWALIPAADKGWVGDLVQADYTTGADGSGNLPTVQGKMTKSSALQRVFFTSAPNTKGKYNVTSNGSTFKSLWSQDTYNRMWNLWAAFKNRHSGL